MEIVNRVSKDNWEEFLDKRHDARLVHTPEWKVFLENTFNYESRYLFAIDESDQVIGMLPLFEVALLSGGCRLCASPFASECSFIGDQGLLDEIVVHARKLSMNLKYLEIRSPIDNSGFNMSNSFSTYILQLSSNADEVWSRLSKNVKRSISNSQKRGVKVIQSRNVEDVRNFYELNCINKREIGVPCHPWSFFKNMFEIISKYSLLYLSLYNNEPIAGGIVNFYKNSVNYGYGAGDPSHLKLSPYYAFIWTSIMDAGKNKFDYYDFGRVSYDNVGLADFKKRWGTDEKKLYYSFYPMNPRPITENRDNVKFKLANKMIHAMPMPIYKGFSERVFGYFG